MMRMIELFAGRIRFHRKIAVQLRAVFGQHGIKIRARAALIHVLGKQFSAELHAHPIGGADDAGLRQRRRRGDCERKTNQRKQG